MVFPTTLVGLALTGPITQFQRLIKGSWTIYGLQRTGFLHGQFPGSSYRHNLITSRFRYKHQRKRATSSIAAPILLTKYYTVCCILVSKLYCYPVHGCYISSPQSLFCSFQYVWYLCYQFIRISFVFEH